MLNVDNYDYLLGFVKDRPLIGLEIGNALHEGENAFLSIDLRNQNDYPAEIRGLMETLVRDFIASAGFKERLLAALEAKRKEAVEVAVQEARAVLEKYAPETKPKKGK